MLAHAWMHKAKGQERRHHSLTTRGSKWSPFTDIWTSHQLAPLWSSLNAKEYLQWGALVCQHIRLHVQCSCTVLICTYQILYLFLVLAGRLWPELLNGFYLLEIPSTENAVEGPGCCVKSITSLLTILWMRIMSLLLPSWKTSWWKRFPDLKVSERTVARAQTELGWVHQNARLE